MQIIALNELQKLWQRVARTEGEIAPKYNIDYIKKVVDIFSVGNYYYYIFNLSTSQIEYIQPEFTRVIGHVNVDNFVEYVIHNIHPDDLHSFMNFESTAADFFQHYSSEAKKDYKIRFDYRLRKTDGNYIRILQQLYTIQTTDDGGVVRVLGIHTDITDLKPTGRPILSFIDLKGIQSFIDVKPNIIYKAAKGVLSNRERQVLNYLSQGLGSKAIGEILCVSTETINTHRRNILRKTSSKNTHEVIVKAINEGWL